MWIATEPTGLTFGTSAHCDNRARFVRDNCLTRGALFEGEAFVPLGRPARFTGRSPAARGCPEVAQVTNKAVGSSLKALGVSFGTHLPASAHSRASGKRAQYPRARAFASVLIRSWRSEL